MVISFKPCHTILLSLFFRVYKLDSFQDSFVYFSSSVWLLPSLPDIIIFWFSWLLFSPNLKILKKCLNSMSLSLFSFEEYLMALAVGSKFCLWNIYQKKKMKITRRKAFPSAWVLRLARNMLKNSLELSLNNIDPNEESSAEWLGIDLKTNTHHFALTQPFFNPLINQTLRMTCCHRLSWVLIRRDRLKIHLQFLLRYSVGYIREIF